MLGLNGSGKSTLLRIMAGIDTDILGEARPQPGIHIGFLPQEPQLDPSKDVRGNIEEAVAPIKAAQARLDEIYAAYADPTPISTSWPPNRLNWNLTCTPPTAITWIAPWMSPPTRCVCRPGMRMCDSTVRRRAASGRAVPAAAGQARHVAAGRADQPPRRRVGGLAGTFPADYSGTVVAVTHDRYSR
ncbi:MAG: ATP-binding cassette domain-containing protein [Candidatus Competibacteraceae bacterium]